MMIVELLWNDPQIIIAPIYDDSRAKIALWNDPQIIIAPIYDDSRAIVERPPDH